MYAEYRIRISSLRWVHVSLSHQCHKTTCSKKASFDSGSFTCAYIIRQFVCTRLQKVKESNFGKVSIQAATCNARILNSWPLHHAEPNALKAVRPLEIASSLPKTWGSLFPDLFLMP